MTLGRGHHSDLPQDRNMPRLLQKKNKKTLGPSSPLSSQVRLHTFADAPGALVLLSRFMLAGREGDAGR